MSSGSSRSLACVVLFPLLGREFMPKLEEGNFWIRATLPMSISLEQSARVRRTDARDPPRVPDGREGPVRPTANRKHPEVVTVVSQLGRPDDGTDVAGFFNIEFFAPLKPFDEWPPRADQGEADRASSTASCSEAFPGVVFNFSQYISDNVEEALSGVKGENSRQGLRARHRVEREERRRPIVDVMSDVPGVKDLGIFQSLGQPSVKIVPDRAACARYGLNTGDVDAVVQAAIGGQADDAGVRRGEALRPDRPLAGASTGRRVEAIREITVSHAPTAARSRWARSPK